MPQQLKKLTFQWTDSVTFSSFKFLTANTFGGTRLPSAGFLQWVRSFTAHRCVSRAEMKTQAKGDLKAHVFPYN